MITIQEQVTARLEKLTGEVEESRDLFLDGTINAHQYRTRAVDIYYCMNRIIAGNLK